VNDCAKRSAEGAKMKGKRIFALGPQHRIPTRLKRWEIDTLAGNFERF
jgi:hypothetical protein